MARRKWNPALHPRDRKGRFTRSATRNLAPGDRSRAAEVMAGFKPRRGVTGQRAAGYLSGISGGRRPAAGGAVHRYLNEGGFVGVHRSLRAGKGADNPDVAELDQAMTTLPDDLLVSRRVPLTMFGDVPPQDLVGAVVRDAAYSPVSLTTVPGNASDVRMRIAVPAGTRAIVSPDTGELILDRDLEMAVASVDRNTAGGWDMHLVVLPKDDADIPARRDRGEDRGIPAGGDTTSAAADDTPDGAGDDTPDGADPDAALRAELMRLRVPELRARARERGLRPGRRRKTELIDMIIADERGDNADTGEPGDATPDTAPDVQPATVPDGGDTPAAPPLTGDAARAAAPVSVAATPRGDITDAERAALISYKGPGYESANTQLRTHRGSLPDTPEYSLLAERIAATDQALAKSRLTADVRVDRGISNGRAVFGDAWDSNLAGAEWTEHGYLSTTTSERMAGFFTGREPGRGARLRIVVPAGTPAAELSGAEGESELMLGRGLRMRVVADTGPGPDRELTVEVVPDGGRGPGGDTGGGAAAAGGGAADRPGGGTPADDDELPGRGDTPPGADAGTAVANPPPADAGAEPAGAGRAPTRTGGGRPRTGPQAVAAAPLGLASPTAKTDLTAGQRDALEYAALPITRSALARVLQPGKAGNERDEIRIAHLDQLTTQSQLTSDVHVWVTGLYPSLLFGDLAKGDLTGVEVVSHGFPAAQTRRPAPDRATAGVVVNLTVPADTGAVSLSRSELLLQRGGTYRVLRDHGRNADGIRVVDAEYVPPTEPPPRERAPDPSRLVDRPPVKLPVYRPSGADNVVSRGVASGVAERQRLSNGMIAETSLVTFRDGSRAVVKKAKAVEGTNARHQQDAEELAPLVLRAVGLRAPEIHRPSVNQLYMEFMDGRLAAQAGLRSYNEDQYLLLGLADQLMDNYDRHKENWLVTDSGDIHPIDHGLAFTYQNGPTENEPVVPGNQPAGLFGTSVDGVYTWLDNDMAPEDLAEVLRRLMAVRGEFERLGRGDWFESMLTRLSHIQRHAKGTKRRVT